MTTISHPSAPAQSPDVVVRICGGAGDGVRSAGQILNRAAALMGYHIMNYFAHPSEIRGFDKSLAHCRIAGQPLLTPGEQADCLISLNDPHAITELRQLRERGILIYDSKPPGYVDEDLAIAGYVEPGMVGYGIPLRELSAVATGTSKARNIVALGVLSWVFRLHPEPFQEAIQAHFHTRLEKQRQGILKAFDLGYSRAAESLVKADAVDFGYRLRERDEEVWILTGSEAAARGCLDAGIRLFAGCPETPPGGLLETLARALPAHGGTVVVAEDEAAAIGLAVGGGFAGQRCATATTGPGLALMSDSLGLAVMAEVPAVVIHAQRVGPSTGLPARTEQSDLLAAIHGGNGDAPRPVLAPANVAECGTLAREAFEIAEAFQTPVVVLTDYFLDTRMEDVVWPAGGLRPSGRYPAAPPPVPGPDYNRYAVGETGISPRAVPGTPGLTHTATGLEHDESGQPDERPETHLRMTAKRHRKLDVFAGLWPDPAPVGPEGDLDIGLLAWGSTVGAAAEAVDRLNRRGVRAGGLFPRLLWPLAGGALRTFAARSRVVLVAEMNHTGQLAGLVEPLLRRPVARFCRVCVLPMTAADIETAALAELGR